MKWLKYINIRLLLVAIPVMLAMAPAVAQTNIVYSGQTSTLSVVEVAGETYTWELYIDDVSINFATEPGNCPITDAYFNGPNTGASVSVTWLTPAVYYFKVTVVNANGCSNIALGMMTVLNALPVALIDPVAPICVGESTQLVINLTGTGPWEIDLSDGTNTLTYSNINSNIFTVAQTPSVSTPYTVTRVADANGVNLNLSNTVTLVVKPRPVTTQIIQYGP